jgi:hypothetical protein
MRCRDCERTVEPPTVVCAVCVAKLVADPFPDQMPQSPPPDPTEAEHLESLLQFEPDSEPPSSPHGGAGKLGKPGNGPWWSSAITAAELDQIDYPPPSYLIDDLLPDGGVVLLGGPPKIGKSYLSYGCSLGIAHGAKALGRLACPQQGNVFIVSLDDQSRRRAQQRMRAIARGEPLPATLTLHTEPNLGRAEQAQRALTDYLAQHPATRLIVVDTLEHLRGDRRNGESAYTADVRFLIAIRAVAHSYPHVTFLCIVHTRKGADEDAIEAISGTHGLTGGADVTITMTGNRQSPKRMLEIISRDGEDTRRILTFTSHGLEVTDDDPDDPASMLTAVDASLYRALIEFPDGATAADLAEAFPNVPKIGNRLSNLHKRGMLTRTQRGLYRA